MKVWSEDRGWACSGVGRALRVEVPETDWLESRLSEARSASGKVRPRGEETCPVGALTSKAAWRHVAWGHPHVSLPCPVA